MGHPYSLLLGLLLAILAFAMYRLFHLGLELCQNFMDFSRRFRGID